MKTTVYICADSTLTYGPRGGTDKVIPAALPILQVDSEEEAISFITLAGKSAYYNPEDIDFLDVKPGYGPKSRYLYYGEEFEKANVETVPLVMERAKELLIKIRGWHNEKIS